MVRGLRSRQRQLLSIMARAFHVPETWHSKPHAKEVISLRASCCKVGLSQPRSIQIAQALRAVTGKNGLQRWNKISSHSLPHMVLDKCEEWQALNC